jgi:hypothetical protein
MIIKKAIILLYPPYNHNIIELDKSLTTYCQDNNLAIIKTIYAEDTFDCDALRQLIQSVNRQSKPVTVIIDRNCYTSFFHICTWCVLGTLSTAKLIDELLVYQGIEQQEIDCPKTKFDVFKKCEFDFLNISSFYFERAMSLIEEQRIRKKTY